MEKRKTVLIFIDWFLPGYKAGGPIQSVANLVENTSAHFNYKIITSDRDLGDTEPYSLELNTWLNIESYQIIYLSPENRTKPKFEEILKSIDFDLVYLNSLFSKEFTLIPLQILNKQYKDVTKVLSPRGMLGVGSLNEKKLKKKIFLSTAKVMGLYKGIEWHATSETEIKDINNHFPSRKSIKYALNIPKKQIQFNPRNKEEAELKLISISRVASIKNLHFGIETLSKVKTHKKIIFDIYGPIEDREYWDSCQKLSLKFPDNITVKHKGSLNPSQISETFSKYHYFLFPTLHENFGHVIHESLAAGCPVILSTETPWRDLEKKNIGYDIPLNQPELFTKAITEVLELNNENYQITSKACYDYISSQNNIESKVNQYINLFTHE